MLNRQIVILALRDLIRDRFFFLANTAIMVGILVPLLVLFGVKNGVYGALVGEMLADPANRQIDTAGNATFSELDIAPMRGWPEVAFLTPKVRSQFDFVNVRKQDGRRIRSALMVPSGAGDPTLPDGVALAEDEVAVSALLAAQLDLSPGDDLQIVTQAEGRPRQLVLERKVIAVLRPRALAGRAVLATLPTLDLIETFYDAYRLPDYGIEDGRDPAGRVPAYEGVRVYARSLEELSSLQARIEAHLDVSTNARTREVEALLGLGRKLNLALALTASLATMGLGAALVLGFWSDVARKRPVLATIALLGVDGARLAVFPAVQAMAVALSGLAVSFALYAVAGRAASALFGQGLPDGAPLAVISPLQAAVIILSVLVVVVLSSALAAWSAMRLDPASVLREVV